MTLKELKNKETVIKSLQNIYNFYEDVKLKNIILNKPKIILYKCLKWPDKDNIQDFKDSDIALIQTNLGKQIKGYSAALDSLLKLVKLMDDKSRFKDAPEIFHRYSGIVQEITKKSRDEITDLIAVLESEKDLLKSKIFKDFSVASLNDSQKLSKYYEFVNLFDQERQIYKDLASAIIEKYREYAQIERELSAYAVRINAKITQSVNNYDEVAQEIFAAFGTIGTIGGIIIIIALFLSSFGAPKDFTSLTGEGLGAIGGGIIGKMIGRLASMPMIYLVDTSINYALKDAIKVHALFD